MTVGISSNLESYKRALGVTTRITYQDLKKLYHQKAAILHPDVNHSLSASDDFRFLTEAYEYIKNDIGLLPKPNWGGQTININLTNKFSNIEIPQGCLDNEDVILHLKWGDKKHEVLIPRMTELPTIVKIYNTDLTVKIWYERHPPR